MPNPYENCTEVTIDCPVSATIYGYYPALAPNAALLAVFAILLVVHIPLIYRYQLWTYSIGVVGGCLLEMLGYAGRIMMNDNPWSIGFEMQMTCLILAPTFLAAGVYLTVKHLIIYYGSEHSRLKPKWYTRIFIGCDVFSILMQAGGGGAAAAAKKSDPGLASVGNGLIIAGIAFQVITMAVCGVIAIDYSIRLRKSKRANGIPQQNRLSRPDIFCVTSALAYLFVLIRCIYRIPEMAGGWGNDLMRHEASFLVLDGLMIAIASTLLTFSYPGVMITDLIKSKKEKEQMIDIIIDSTSWFEADMIMLLWWTSSLYNSEQSVERERT